MANKDSNPVVICGITFSAEEVFGPSSLRAMFGPTLPKTLRVDHSGAVPVAQVEKHLRHLHQKAAAAFDAHSIVLAPRHTTH